MLHESDVIQQFVQEMHNQGISVSPQDIIADGKFRRVKANGSRDKTAWYVLHYDERPAGSFGCNRLYGNDVKFNWKADVKLPPMSAAEKRAYRERMERARAERDAQLAADRAAAAERANRIWDGAAPCDGDHPYLERKGVQAHNLRIGRWERIDQDTGEVYWSEPNALLVPVRDLQKRIHSLQAIFPERDATGRDKDYLAGGAKEGLFHVIGRPLQHDGKMVLVICEGYATGASIHQTTGHCAIIAFDAPNLLPVAKVWRERFPDAIIIMAADNDQWTDKPVKNPGVTRAMQCVDEVGALVAIPPIPYDFGEPDENGRLRGPTDFNDLHEIEGGDAVRAVFDAVLNPPPPPPIDEPEFNDEDEHYELPPSIDDDDDSASSPERNGHFTILGHDRGRYYIFNHGTKQITGMTAGDFSSIGLLKIAPLNWWEFSFPNGGKTGGFNREAAAEFIFRTAERRGIYDTGRIRGRGAWIDDGRTVYHHGAHLSVNGRNIDVTEIESRYVYELGKSLPTPSDQPLEDEEGQSLLELFQHFRWTTQGSAVLLAGWVALAPVCGAIPWRPHLWITGGASSGKSTIAKMVHSLLRGTDVFAQGNSSEAGIRQELQADALPVLMDESESNEEGDARRIQSILSLIRQASTESDARTLKGTADGQGMSFHIRSMFCLASIQVALKHKADIDRLSVLNLRSSRGPGDKGIAWKDLREIIYSTVERDQTVPARLLRRVIDLLPTTLKNIEVFTDVCAEAFSSQRDGDQYGTLMAGAWSLISSELATREDAENMLRAYDWTELLEGADEDESTRALMALMEGKIRISGIDVTVYELVCEASGVSSGVLQIAEKAADAYLQRNGMRVRDGYLIISNSSNEPAKLVAGTAYSSDLRGMLLRIPGADKNDNKPLKFNGVQSKCVRVPLGPILHDDKTIKTYASETETF